MQTNVGFDSRAFRPGKVLCHAGRIGIGSNMERGCCTDEAPVCFDLRKCCGPKVVRK